MVLNEAHFMATPFLPGAKPAQGVADPSLLWQIRRELGANTHVNLLRPERWQADLPIRGLKTGSQKPSNSKHGSATIDNKVLSRPV
jgi:hypothetical protein